MKQKILVALLCLFSLPLFAVEGNDVLTESEQAYIDQIVKKAIKEVIIKKTIQDKKQAVTKEEKQIAFKKTIDKNYPLSPNDIITIRKKQDDIENATKRKIKKVRKNVKVIEKGLNDPDASTINLAPSYLSTIEFFDSTGEPWPLVQVDMIQGHYKEPKITGVHKNQIQVAALDKYADSNIVVVLEGCPRAFNIYLSSNDAVADIKTTIVLKERGPKAKPTSSIKINSEIDEQILNFAIGIPPQKSKRINVTGMQGEAWLLNDYIYVRTTNIMNCPAYVMSRKLSGINVYKFKPVAMAGFSSPEGERLQVSFSINDGERL